MDKVELTKGLKELNFKNARIEKDLELPQNSLSAVLNGHKIMPDKWVEKVKTYLEGFAPAPEVFDAPKMTDAQDEVRFPPPSPWVSDIREFCENAGIDPLDLIKWYKAPEMAPKPPPPKPEQTPFPDNWSTLGKVAKLQWLTAHR